MHMSSVLVAVSNSKMNKLSFLLSLQVVNILLDEKAAVESSTQLQPCRSQSDVSSGYVTMSCTWKDISGERG